MNVLINIFQSIKSEKCNKNINDSTTFTRSCVLTHPSGAALHSSFSLPPASLSSPVSFPFPLPLSLLLPFLVSRVTLSWGQALWPRPSQSPLNAPKQRLPVANTRTRAHTKGEQTEKNPFLGAFQDLKGQIHVFKGDAHPHPFPCTTAPAHTRLRNSTLTHAGRKRRQGRHVLRG